VKNKINESLGRRRPSARRPRGNTGTPRAVRRRPSKRRGNGLSFFLGMLFVLALALIYFFFGDNIIPGRGGDVVFPYENEIVVSFLDVGQGESILIRSAEHTVLIDGGEFRARGVIRDYLRAAGIRRIDYVVATHPHSDHIGGLVYVLGRYEIGRVLMPDVTHNTETFLNFLEAIENNNIDVHFPTPGERISAGIIEFTVVAPRPGFHANLNNASIVLRMQHGRTSFLFTGDAEGEAERWMLSSDVNLRSDVLKVGHHGSHTSTTPAFLDAVNPRIAVIQSGADNRFGHPHQRVLQSLEARNVEILRNDELGTIRMITNGENILIY